MKFFIICWVSIFVFLALQANGQGHQSHEGIGEVAPQTVNFGKIKQDFFPNVLEIAPKPGGGAYQERLKQIKSNRETKIFDAVHKRADKEPGKKPEVVKGFRGNESGGIPNDNDLAISPEGKIVSVVNPRISIFDTSGQKLEAHSLEAFADTLNIDGRKYDPRVAYDPGKNRFVIAFLNGRLDSTSHIILGFSQSNDPTGNWHLYALPGDPLNNKSWSDFPAMALTKDELFLTVNLIYNDSTWQKGFRQSIIWQIDKQKAYSGDTLDTRLYSDIKYKSHFIRNLTPVEGEPGLKGPGIYLISNKNFAEKTDTFFLLRVTAKKDDNPDLEVDMIKSDNAYGVPPEANQPKGGAFATNDARILSAFIQNGRIHFAGNSVNFRNNRATVYHGQITDLPNNPQITLNILDHPRLELGYPSLEWAGNAKSENKLLMIANHTSDSVNAGYSGIFFKEGQYSAFQMLKKGSSHVNVQLEEPQRWGDYSGLERNGKSKGKFWAAGYYGYEGQFNAPTNGTWITKIAIAKSAGISNTRSFEQDVSAYPNPAQDKVKVNFELDQYRYLSFELFNSQGQKIRTLRKQLASPGENRFQFSVSPLPNGIYWLAVRNQGERIATKKVVKK